jgi:hypothetical protein
MIFMCISLARRAQTSAVEVRVSDLSPDSGVSSSDYHTGQGRTNRKLEFTDFHFPKSLVDHETQAAANRFNLKNFTLLYR